MADAIIYCRVSTDRQADRGVSLSVQEGDCRRLAEAAGDAVLDVLVDPGEDSGTLDRPAMQRLLARLASHNAEAVYVWDLDRFSRDIVDQIMVCRMLEDRGQRIISVRQRIDYTTADGRTYTHILAALAQGEREKLRERVRAAQMEKIARGEPQQPAPLGYEYDGKQWVIEPEGAKLVRDIFRVYAAGTVGFAGVAAWLRDTGVPPVRGGRYWRDSVVRAILTNRAYIGILKWGEHVYEGDYEPIIPRELWQRVQERIERRGDIHPRTLNASIASCYTCGVCGSHVLCAKAAVHRYYQCGAQRRAKVHREERVWASELAVNRIVWLHTREVLQRGHLAAGAQALREQLAAQAATSQREDLAQRIHEIETRIRRNLEAYHASGISAEMLAEQNAPLHDELARAKELLEAEAARAGGPSPGALERLTAGALDAVIEGGNVERQRQLLELLYEPIEIGADHAITIRARWPAEPVRYAIPRYYSPQRGRGIDDLSDVRL